LSYKKDPTAEIDKAAPTTQCYSQSLNRFKAVALLSTCETVTTHYNNHNGEAAVTKENICHRKHPQNRQRLLLL
jgi:hypothetical protein